MSDWLRVSRSKVCPICDKPDWCTVTADGSAVCCMRTESAQPLDNGGWLHKLNGSPRTVPPPQSKPAPTARTDLPELAKSYGDAVQSGELEQLAHDLGVTAGSLQRLGVGWDGRAWTFPMLNAERAIVGIRRRFPDGRKLSTKGGHEGVFIPADLSDDDPLLICEGPTDTAAMLDLGFAAIGRPSCSGGTRIIPEIARGRDVVIVADADAPGQRGAARLGAELAGACPTVRIVTPPEGLKDGRQWKCAGATREDVETLISAAEVIEPEPKAPPPVPQWRPFPTVQLPERLRAFVQAVARATNTNPSYAALAALVVCAGCIGNRAAALVKSGWSEPAVLWAALVGRSGTMKSPVLKLVTRALVGLFQKWRLEYADAQKQYLREVERHSIHMAE